MAQRTAPQKIVKEYLHAEDYDFYSRFCRYSEIHNIQEILYLYRIHGNNVSVKHASIQSRNSEKVRQDILNFLTHDHITQFV